MRESAVAERRRTRVAELEFTGCEPVRVSGAEIFGPEWEGRKLEYWHAATEIAWMVRELASRWHERPARRLARLLERIVEARGSDVECLGSTDLRIRETVSPPTGPGGAIRGATGLGAALVLERGADLARGGGTADLARHRRASRGKTGIATGSGGHARSSDPIKQGWRKPVCNSATPGGRSMGVTGCDIWRRDTEQQKVE